MLDEFTGQTTQRVEKALMYYFSKNPPYASTVYESMKYTLFSGGKRIRPMLMLMIGQTFFYDLEKVMPFACAVEIVHTSSLILDDLPCMDNAQMRRNKPANHLVFGEEIAILAAIGLLTKAFAIFAEEHNTIEHHKLCAMQQILAHAISEYGLIGGQSLDLISKNKKIDLDTLHYIHHNKTASLFIAAIEMSCIQCDATTTEITALKTYAENIGLAFQISDDLNDLLLSEKESGKDAQKDSTSTTFISYYGIDGTRNLINELITHAKDSLRILTSDTSLLNQLADKMTRT